MSPRRTLATTTRIVRQLRHDPRTIALLIVVPVALETLLKYVFDDNSTLFAAIAPSLLGVFPFIVMFLVASISTLRERTGGTMERLLTLPLGKLEFIMGYALAFAVAALVQGAVVSSVTLGLLGVDVAGGVVRLLTIVVLSGILGSVLGLFVSAFATSEFQAVQFMPAFIFPQLLTCGLFVPRDQMAWLLRWFSDIMPLTYLVDAMKRVNTEAVWTHDLRHDVIIILAFIVGSIVLAALTLRRQS